MAFVDLISEGVVPLLTGGIRKLSLFPGWTPSDAKTITALGFYSSTLLALECIPHWTFLDAH